MSERETPMGPVDSDGSMENFYRLFKNANPRGTVVEYQAWMEHLGKLQSEVIGCPWCDTLPDLQVWTHPDGLRYKVACHGLNCNVNPHTKLKNTPERAVAAWRWK